MKVTLYCAMCNTRAETEAPTPDGWVVRHGIDEERGAFCPRHTEAEKFIDDQCPGCMMMFGDCGLSDTYQEPRRRTITDDQLAVIASGRCPFRVNGTMMTSNTAAGVTIEDVDLSEVSSAGQGMVDAIREYIEQWPTPPDWPLAPWGEKRTDDGGRTWVCRGGWELDR